MVDMEEQMTKINPDDFEDQNWERPKRYKRRKGPPTLADKAQREEEIRSAREARVREAEEKIKRHLSSFPRIETEEGRDQVQKYVKWVEDSLRLNGARFDPEDNRETRIDNFVPSVKAGGQQRQKSHSAVRVTHMPTKIVSSNQDERVAESNKKAAIETLAQRLEAHLELWRTLKRNAIGPINIEEKVISLIQLKTS